MEIIMKKDWVSLLLRGIIAVIFGLIALIYPSITLSLLIVFFGIYVFAYSILAIISSIYSHSFDPNWWLHFLEGLIGVIAGIMVFSWPTITAIILFYIIAAWAIVTGILQIILYIKLQKVFANEVFIGLSGILALIIGILLFRFPIGGIIMAAWLIGFFALIFGILLIASAFRIRGAMKK